MLSERRWLLCARLAGYLSSRKRFSSVFQYKEVEMKKVAIGLLFSLVASVAYAACSTHTYFVNGRYVTCTTCCYGSNCNTNCF